MYVNTDIVQMVSFIVLYDWITTLFSFVFSFASILIRGGPGSCRCVKTVAGRSLEKISHDGVLSYVV
jgi:hypothetical protein